MATTIWYIQKNETIVGPLTAQQLRELALAGKLQNDDLVRKGDNGKFAAASQIKNLFVADQVSSRPTPPPPRLPSEESSAEQIDPALGSLDSTPKNSSRNEGELAQSNSDSLPAADTHSWSSQLKQHLLAARTKLADFGKQAAQAGELGKLVARRTQLQQHQLPQAFSALGSHIYAERQFVEEFPSHFAEIDEAVLQQSELVQPSPPECGSQDLKGKLKGVADGLLRRGKETTLGLKLGSLHRKLGEAVFQQHGSDSGPTELVAPIEKAESEIREIEKKIGDLESVSKGRILTPKRILTGGVIAVCVLVLLAAFSVGRIGNDVSDEFVSKLPSSIDDERLKGKSVTIVGVHSISGYVYEDGERTDQYQVMLDTEYRDVVAVCRFSGGNGKEASKTTDECSQLTVTGILKGRYDGFADDSLEGFIIDECTIVSSKKRGHETIQKFSIHLQLPKSDSFMKQLAVMQGITEDTPPPKRNYDSYSGFFLEPRHYYKVGIELDYDEWVEAFGEPTSVRQGPHGGHVWQQVYNGKVVYLSGALKTGLHFAPMIKVRRLDPNAYPESQWKVIVHAVSVD